MRWAGRDAIIYSKKRSSSENGVSAYNSEKGEMVGNLTQCGKRLNRAVDSCLYLHDVLAAAAPATTESMLLRKANQIELVYRQPSSRPQRWGVVPEWT